MDQLYRTSVMRTVLIALLGSGCVGDETVTSIDEQDASTSGARTFAVSAGTITGLDFPGSFPQWGSGRTIRFKFTNPHLKGLPIYGPGGNGVTYIWRLYPREPARTRQTYLTTFFWGNDDGQGWLPTFEWRNGQPDSYYGAHPYPHPYPSNVHDWEISTDMADYVQPHPLGVVQWERWYTQAFVAWTEPGTGRKITRFYWDLDNPDSNHIVEHIAPASFGNATPPAPALTWGDAPWNPGSEVMDGVLRGIQIYNTRLSLAEIQAEAGTPRSTSTGSTSIWYLNLNPTPTDISDKSGKGHHPVWVGNERPALYTADGEGGGESGADTIPPSTPANLAATPVSVNQIDLSWSASADNVGIAGYAIHRGGVQIATVTAGTDYEDTGLAPSTSYNYTVRAFDAAGNESAPSPVVSATTADPPPDTDTTPPSIPTNLAAVAVSTAQIDLSWSGSSDNVGVVGYTINRGGVQIANVTSGTSYQDTGLTASTSYSYRVRAYDAAGNQSALSPAVSATTLSDAPPPPPSNGLIAHWALDDAVGVTATDASGNNFHGTLANGARWATGKKAGAVFFDGVDDKVDLGTDFDISAVPFTIAVWVRPRDFDWYRPILSKRDLYAPDRMRFQFDIYRGTGQVRLMNGRASSMTFNYTPPLGVWTHLAIVARVGSTRLYVNGVLKQTFARTFVLGTAAQARAAIGDLGGQSGENFAGRIDDVRVYNRALTTTEINQLRQ